MKNIIVTEEQLAKVIEKIKPIKEEEKQGSYMAKQQLFTIATLAYKMWENMEDGEQLEDWMETKIAQSESSIISVVKSFMYDEVKNNQKGMDTLGFDDLVIGA
jgi:hypothetical protein